MHTIHWAEDGPRDFATTRWTIVFSVADPEARVAREAFARLYWGPLYAWARARGYSLEDAADAVQSFLSDLMNSAVLLGLSRERGRFRNYLRTGLEHYLISEFRRETAQRRRPPEGFLRFDVSEVERQLAEQVVEKVTPESIYDRQCARVLLDAALNDLRKEYERAGRAELCAHLTQVLDREDDRQSHAAAAERLGLEEASLRTAAWRFRKRFGELFRLRVTATVDDPSAVEDEMRSLLAAVSE
jgi:RNA polymerase sigma-70 factor (ECF subfamily)